MIGFISGKIIHKTDDNSHCIVLTSSDVGYELAVPAQWLGLRAMGEAVSVWVHTHVREDQLVLFGFSEEKERRLFRLLLGVNGLGPKSAMALLSYHGYRQVIQRVLFKDANGLAEAPGIGKKLAQRLVMELAGKFEKDGWETAVLSFNQPTAATQKGPGSRLDLESALINLGYTPNAVRSAVDRVFDRLAEEERSNFELAFRSALNELSGRSVGTNG